MNTALKKLALAAAGLVVMLAPAATAGATATHASHGPVQIHANGICYTLYTIPVALAPGAPVDQTISGTYCVPFNWGSGQHQIDIMTEGATYNGTYWDWPVKPSKYSYVDKVLAKHRATFAFDRLGSGHSSHPNSSLITIDADAFSEHQVIQAMKALGYPQVNLDTHSYGAGMAVRETAQYHDATRLILTGYLNVGNNPVITEDSQPANIDPAFMGQGLDDGYFTTVPGKRLSAFYDPATADPAVVKYDEDHKDLLSLTGLLGFLDDRAAPAASNLSNQITVPVLLVDGQHDFVQCFDPTMLDCTNESAVKAFEAPFYTAAPSLTVRMIPNTGHDVALHPSADDSFDIINEWIRTH